MQHDFNESVKAWILEFKTLISMVKAKLEEAASRVEPAVGDEFTKAKEALKEGLQLLEDGQKLIKIADRSESGCMAGGPRI